MSKLIQSAIVIGGTGLVGRALLKLLNENAQCERVVAIVRNYDHELESLDKVEQRVIEDFLMLNDQDVNGFSHAFSCLGSTIKKAGSKANFYTIDFEMNAHFADLFTETETHYVLVSAQGADAGSIFFYNQVKGELERHLKNANLNCVSIVRPSLLIGERNEKRTLEDLSQKIFKGVSQFIPDTFIYKPVTAVQVAHTMVEVAQTQTEKFQIYDNLQIQKSI